MTIILVERNSGKETIYQWLRNNQIGSLHHLMYICNNIHLMHIRFPFFFFVTTIYRDVQLLKEKKAQVKHIFTPPK